MEMIKITIADAVRERVEREISALLEDVNKSSEEPRPFTGGFDADGNFDETIAKDAAFEIKLEKLKGPNRIPLIYDKFTEIVKQEMPEAVEALSKQLETNDPPMVIISNAPMAGPFGQGNDRQFKEQFSDNAQIEDRKPIAEYMTMALLKAAGHTADVFANDNHGRAWSYPTPLNQGQGGNNEEHGAKAMFPFHTDGSMNRAPSEFITLCTGQGHPEAQTIIADQPKLLQSLEDDDAKHNTNYAKILSEPIFLHVPGTSSADADDAIKAPIINTSETGKVFFRGNLAVNDQGPRIGLVDGLDISKQTLAREAIKQFKAHAEMPENHVNTTLQEGDIAVFPNGPHSRTPFESPDNAKDRRFVARINSSSTDRSNMKGIDINETAR